MFSAFLSEPRAKGARAAAIRVYLCSSVAEDLDALCVFARNSDSAFFTVSAVNFMEYPLQYYPAPLAKLIEELMKLPGIGIKSAQRIAFHLLRASLDEQQTLSESIARLRQQIRYCSVCWNFTDIDPCKICNDAQREDDLICVVEEPTTLIAIEKTREFRGKYHVLLGCLDPLRGIGPADIKIQELADRLKRRPAREVILATNPTVEGEATAVYISKLIQHHTERLTRIALGVPVGGDLDYVDEVTMARAILGRRSTFDS